MQVGGHIDADAGREATSDAFAFTQELEARGVRVHDIDRVKVIRGDLRQQHWGAVSVCVRDE